MQALLLSLLLATPASDTAVQQRVYVLGTSVNLRQAPSKDSETLGKSSIGTECLVSERPEGEWLKVRCGEVEGYAAASLLGVEKPSPDKLRAEARDPQLKLEQREQSALRAALLSPEDADAQKEWAQLFFERNFDFVARLKKPVVKRTFTYMCRGQQGAACLWLAGSTRLKDAKVRAEVKQNLFVVVVGNSETLTVHRGRFRLNKKTSVLTGEVLEQSGITSMPVMERALFSDQQGGDSDKWSPPFGQFILDEPSQTILNGLSREWGLLLPAEDGIVEMQWNDCLEKPYKMQFLPDILGRWRIAIDKIGSNEPYSRWISAISKHGNELELTLEDVYGGGTTHELLKLPPFGGDIAHLGDTAYSSNIRKYPEKHIPCSEGGP